MEQKKAAHFDIIKLQNKKLIKNLLRQESPQSIHQLAQNALLSYPTVSALLKELEQTKEVLLSKQTLSYGGRPGIHYELNSTHQYGLVLRLEDRSLHTVIYDAFGLISAKETFPIDTDLSIATLRSIILEIQNHYPTLSAVSIGIPGVVFQNEIKYLPMYPALNSWSVRDLVEKELHLQVFIENDVNAIAFSRVHICRNFAHIAYINHCIGVGIILNGEIVYGANGFAGEMEYLCDDLNNQEDTLMKSILSLVSVLDLPEISISGIDDKKSTIADLTEILKTKLPLDRIPHITVLSDTDSCYENGLLQKILMYWEK